MERLDELVKGPLGIMPRSIWHEHNRYPGKKEMDERVAAIGQAIARFNSAGIGLPIEWKEELADLNEALKNNF
jgi:hypothetical protein